MAGPVRNVHGATVRGLTLARESKFFGGQFGRMFRSLPPADFGVSDTETENNLLALGNAMVADPDAPKDATDDEESGIPAAYTYLGQFIDHDLTFDPASSLQQQDDPEGLVDFRTPRFDLDNLYGKGPDDAPYLYHADNTFILGRRLTGAESNPNARDLPRSQPDLLERDAEPSRRENMKDSRRAIIGDPRNDENVIVSQFQGLMLRFHNKLMLEDQGPLRTRFQRVQAEVRFHYQWMVVNDFLPTIVCEEVLRQVIPHHYQSDPKKQNVRATPPKLMYYDLDHEPVMPLEFSGAAYRFGHSMVRPGYRLSETVPPLPIFSPDPDRSLTGFHEFRDNWAMDWGRFIDLAPLDFGNEDAKDPINRNRLQLAYKIDTSLVDPLRSLPNPPFDPPLSLGGTKLTSLAQRNLMRGWRLRLPSGQAVARAMGIEPLTDDKILIGKYTNNDSDIKGTILDFDKPGTYNPDAFRDNCPLWTYILAETLPVDVPVKTKQGDRSVTTRRLGLVGGRIVAETFIGLLLADTTSYFNLDPIWKPSRAIDGRFGLRELIKTALS